MDFLRYCNFAVEDDHMDVLQDVVYEEADAKEYSELLDLDTYSNSTSTHSISPVEYMQLSDGSQTPTTNSPDSSVADQASRQYFDFVNEGHNNGDVELQCSYNSITDFSENIKWEEIESKQKTKSSPSSDPFLPPCRVCDQKASGFHYGANTCEACKGFFRRSIVKIIKKKEKYKCSKDKNCPIGPGRRSMCAYCRYKKCLDIGMSQEAIKTGRYTYEKKFKDTKEVMQLRNKDLVNNNDPELSNNEQEVADFVEKLVSVQEKLIPDFKKSFEVNFLLEKQREIYAKYKEKQELFGGMKSLPYHVYEEVYNETGLDLGNRFEKMGVIANSMEKNIRNMVDFVRIIPGFLDLSTKDQLSLIKSCFSDYWFLAAHKRINLDLQVVCGSVNAHFEELLGLMKKDYLDEVCRVTAKLQKFNMTMEEVTLLRAITLTYGDRCDLENPEKVDKIQWKLINYLRCFLRKCYENPDQRLWQIFDSLTSLRNLETVARNVHEMRSKWPVMQDHPLVLDVIKCST